MRAERLLRARRDERKICDEPLKRRRKSDGGIRWSFGVFVRFQYGGFHELPRFRIEGVRDVFVLSVSRFPAGHRDKKTVRTLQNFDVVHDKAIVYGDGGDCLQFSRAFDKSDSYI